MKYEELEKQQTEAQGKLEVEKKVRGMTIPSQDISEFISKPILDFKVELCGRLSVLRFFYNGQVVWKRRIGLSLDWHEYSVKTERLTAR